MNATVEQQSVKRTETEAATATEKICIRAGIAGGAGYTGGELIRLLMHHPQVKLAYVHSRSHAGKPLHQVHPDLIGETDLTFSNDPSVFSQAVDVLFLCLGHGESKKFFAEQQIPSRTKIIDLSQDYRLAADAADGERNFVYGLPELNRKQIQATENVANPGCFATSIQLGLLPLAHAGLLAEVYTTGITGSTGAGQSLSPTSHFSWRANNIQAYKTLTHQHLKEIYQSLHQLQPSFPSSPDAAEKSGVNFVPWRGDFTRGIFSSSTLTCDLSLEEIRTMYQAFYQNHPFTILSEDEIFLKQVVNTNKCLIHLEKAGSKLVVHSAIDNLLKGASGQAVQNMNLMFGFDEKTGLQLKPAAF